MRCWGGVFWCDHRGQAGQHPPLYTHILPKSAKQTRLAQSYLIWVFIDGQASNDIDGAKERSAGQEEGA